DATDEIVFLVGHDPRAVTGTVIPNLGVAVVSGLHRAVAVVTAVDFAVAIVEAATGVIVVTVDHPVLTLGLIVHRGAMRVVQAHTHAVFDEDAVGLVAEDGHGRPIGQGEAIEPAHDRGRASAAARSLTKMVFVARLIVKRGNPAIGVRAKSVL